MEDNLYKASTAFFISEPEEQKSEAEQERERVIPYVPVLQQIADRLKERATFYDSIDSVEVDVTSSPEAHKLQVLANKQTKANLLQEFQIITDLIEDNAK